MVEQLDEGAKHREDRRLPAAVLLGEPAGGSTHGAFDPVAGRDELLERAQLGQRGGDRRQQHHAPRAFSASMRKVRPRATSASGGSTNPMSQRV